MGVVGLAYLLPKPYRSTAVIQQAFTTISGERGFPWLRKEPEMKFSDIPSLLAWFLLGELLLWFSLSTLVYYHFPGVSFPAHFLSELTTPYSVT